MAHYAILNENKIVTQVIVGKDENEQLPEGYDSWEQYYGGLRTSYNTHGNKHDAGGTPFRGNYAGIGYTYNDVLDVFISPKPFPSWKLDYSTYLWIAPVPEPEPKEGYAWKWIEENQEWIDIPLPTE